MNPTALLILAGAAAAGLGGGFLIVEGWLPWPAAVAILVAGLAYAVFRIRKQVGETLSTQAKRLRRKKAAE